MARTDGKTPLKERLEDLIGEMVAGLQEETRAMARALERLDKPDLRD